MITFLLTGFLCAPTKIINHTKTWEEIDQMTLDKAKTGCGLRFPKAPCVTFFIKMEPLVHRVRCGPEKAKSAIINTWPRTNPE